MRESNNLKVGFKPPTDVTNLLQTIQLGKEKGVQSTETLISAPPVAHSHSSLGKIRKDFIVTCKELWVSIVEIFGYMLSLTRLEL